MMEEESFANEFKSKDTRNLLKMFFFEHYLPNSFSVDSRDESFDGEKNFPLPSFVNEISRLNVGIAAAASIIAKVNTRRCKNEMKLKIYGAW